MRLLVVVIELLVNQVVSFQLLELGEEVVRHLSDFSLQFTSCLVRKCPGFVNLLFKRRDLSFCLLDCFAGCLELFGYELDVCSVLGDVSVKILECLLEEASVCVGDTHFGKPVQVLDVESLEVCV